MSDSSTAADSSMDSQKGFRNAVKAYLDQYPSFLKLLFFVDMWERFSYYGMRSLLVLYLTSQLGFDDPKAYALYSLFAALAYAIPMLGGLVADKLVGFRNMVYIGGIILTLGHLILAFEGVGSIFVYGGLATIAVGVGFFKGNIMNLLGSCYKRDDPQRNRGFTMMYVSVNLGAALASITCSILAQKYGWSYGFGLAGIGMAMGLLTYARLNKKILGNRGDAPNPGLLQRRVFMGLKPLHLVFMGTLFLTLGCIFALKHTALFTDLLTLCGLAALSYVIFRAYQQDAEHRQRLMILGIFIFFQMCFYAFEMQLGSLMNLFADRNVDRNILGWVIPASSTQSINPTTIMLVGPFIAALMGNFGKKREAYFFSLGLFLMVLSFFILYVGCLVANDQGLIPFAFLLIAIAIMALGELFIAPLVYNFCTLLSPSPMRGLMMGALTLGLAFSNLFGNVIAKFVSVPRGQDALCAPPTESLAIYQSGFLKFALFNLVVWAVYTMMAPFLKRRLIRAQEFA